MGSIPPPLYTMCKNSSDLAEDGFPKVRCLVRCEHTVDLVDCCYSIFKCRKQLTVAFTCDGRLHRIGSDAKPIKDIKIQYEMSNADKSTAVQ